MDKVIDVEKMHAWNQEAFRTAFLGKTADHPRPTAALYPGTHERVLGNAQAGWDEASAANDKLAAFNAESARKRAEQRQAEEAELAKRRQRAEDEWLAPAKRHYLMHGGTDEGWQRDRAAIADQARRQAAVSAVPPDAVRSLVNVGTI